MIEFIWTIVQMTIACVVVAVGVGAWLWLTTELILRVLH